jgi:rhamnogalacturonan endolyase
MNIVKLTPINELRTGLLFDPKDGFFNGVQTDKIEDYHIGNWYNPIEYYMYGGYFVNDGAGMPWTVENTSNGREIFYPYEIRRAVATMSYGELEWRNYHVSVNLSQVSGIDYSGIAFRYQDSRRYYALVVGRYDKLTLLRRHHEQWDVICDSFTVLKDNITDVNLAVNVNGNQIQCYYNGDKIYDVKDDFYTFGNVALVTYSEAHFNSMELNISQDELDYANKKKADHEIYVKKKAESFPKPVLYKSFKTPEYSLGELKIFDGANEPLAVFVQSEHLAPVEFVGNVFYNITCITVTDLEGNIKWQLGKPGIGKSKAACYQVYDIDGDGIKEIIATKDFEILIINLETGDIKRRCPTPVAPRYAVPYTDGPEDYYPHICGDAIFICDTTGNGIRDGFLIKDRYNNIWAYDTELNMLWTMHLVTGHFPYAADINGDGLEEILIGHSCVSPSGELLWRMPLGDHIDQICAGRFTDNPKEPIRIAYCAGEEGFILTDANGNILVKQEIGHVQKMCVGHFSNDLSGQQFIVYTLWGDQGILYAIDCEGNIITSKQLGHRCRIRAINWAGNGTANLIFDTRGKYDTAFYDIELDKICNFEMLDPYVQYGIEIKNLTGDSRDEIILSTPEEVFIFTQENSGEIDVIPMENPMPPYNLSGYRNDWYCRK